eukprot:7536194-Pyramimonas_sp.AAC.1
MPTIRKARRSRSKLPTRTARFCLHGKNTISSRDVRVGHGTHCSPLQICGKEWQRVPTVAELGNMTELLHIILMQQIS